MERGGRLQFDSRGKLLSVDRKLLDFSKKFDEDENEEDYTYDGDNKLKTSKELSFLDESNEKVFEDIFSGAYWSLFKDNEKLSPLKFSNGKTQEDVVKEIVGLVENGKKIILLHGVCGTGKSAIALNIARKLGKTSIVVPVKGLQKQYEEDYTNNMYLLKQNGKKLKIAMITGRDNHDSVIVPGVPCSDPNLPDTIKFSEKNHQKLKEYYLENPYISSTSMPDYKNLKRISIAPANPYWSPILPSSIELNHFKDAKKKKYKGMNGEEFTFYHRKPGCSYYDQYLSYLDSDVIIFNSAKYLAEAAIGRKPQTEVEIIDEADEFLDNLSNQASLNLTRLSGALKMIVSDSGKVEEMIKEIIELIALEEKNKRILGVVENEIYPIRETKMAEILKLLSNPELESEIMIDEINYANQALEAAKDFIGAIDDTYVSFNKREDSLFATIVTTNLEKKFKKLANQSKAMVLMSGTLPSENVLKHLFGIKDYAIVEAETINQGAIEIIRTGSEFDCRYSNFKSGNFSREDYLNSLLKSIDKSKKPTLVHVNAFNDLPTNEEINRYQLSILPSQENLKSTQEKDKLGKKIREFKSGFSKVLFTTKCSRGIDFPGETCNSVVFTKYPNPNVQGTFWKVLQKTHPEYYWEFYKDKANREFLQRIYRALRSKKDHVYVLSPDLRVLNSVRSLQLESAR